MEVALTAMGSLITKQNAEIEQLKAQIAAIQSGTQEVSITDMVSACSYKFSNANWQEENCLVISREHITIRVVTANNARRIESDPSGPLTVYIMVNLKPFIDYDVDKNYVIVGGNYDARYVNDLIEMWMNFYSAKASSDKK